MAVYEYLCNDCGPFTDMRPMAESDLPSNCPSCKASSPRVMLTAPRLSGGSSSKGFSASEATGPRLGSSHGGGCSCCTGMMRRGRGASGGSGSS